MRFINFLRDTKLFSELGSALIEYSVSAVLLVGLMFGVVDVGFLLTNHLKVEQAAREGARAASRLVSIAEGDSAPNLDTPFQSPPPNVDGCNAGSLDEGLCSHVRVHIMTRNILRNQRILGVDVSEVDIVSSYSPSAAGDINSDTVSVSVNAYYDGFFTDYPISTEFTSPFLFDPGDDPVAVTTVTPTITAIATAVATIVP